MKNIHKEYIPNNNKAIESLATNPYPSGLKNLSGSEKTYRIRIGEYRIIYDIE